VGVGTRAEVDGMVWNDPRPPVSSRAVAAARTLRRAMTEPERRLWWHLRHRLSIGGTHFRRQVAIGPYVTDFCCLGARLVVEVDGDQHGSDAGLAHDARRDVYLAQQGFRILRFSNYDVVRHVDEVLDTILAALDPAPPPPPAPSPQGGGESALL
jgi:very-short-patch-repair endonuclease